MRTDKVPILRKETLLYCVPILVSSLMSGMLWLAKLPLSSTIVIKLLWLTRRLRTKTLWILVWSVSAYLRGCNHFVACW